MDLGRVRRSIGRSGLQIALATISVRGAWKTEGGTISLRDLSGAKLGGFCAHVNARVWVYR